MVKKGQQFNSYADIEIEMRRLKNENDDLISQFNILEREYLLLKDNHDDLKVKFQKLNNELSSSNILLRKKDKELLALKLELEKMQNQFVKKTRQISNDQVKEIKELRSSGMSYRKITEKTGWSSVTINRVINGVYD